MNGKKLAIIVVSVVIVASLFAVASILLFFKFYEPNVNVIETLSLTTQAEQFIITLNSR